jgi:hypothetical protein
MVKRKASHTRGRHTVTEIHSSGEELLKEDFTGCYSPERAISTNVLTWGISLFKAFLENPVW